LVAVLALAVACPGPARAGGDEAPAVMLSITGEAGVRVRGRCLVETPAGDWVWNLDEAVPVERRSRGRGLRCELAAVGPVMVEMTRGGSRSLSWAEGGRVALDVR
jgi:hypothetical protein